MIRVICVILWLSLTVAAQAPEILKVDPPSWWARSSVNPVRLLIQGRNLQGARVEVLGSGLRIVSTPKINVSAWTGFPLTVVPFVLPLKCSHH